MAASASKKKQKGKGKVMSLNDFLGDSAPPTHLPSKSSSDNWADQMEEDDVDTVSDYGYGTAQRVNRAALPTAPRAARGCDIDPARLPSGPPYTAYMGNLPYDVDEKKIRTFFEGLKVVNVRIPNEGGRPKGFGYTEFEDKESLINALSLNEENLLGRKIRVDLAEQNQKDGEMRRDGDRRGGGRDRDQQDRGDPDRAEGDWRSNRVPVEQPVFGGGSRDRGGFDRSDRDGFSRGGYDRDDRRGGGGFEDRRGGGFDDRRGGYDDRRGGYDDRRGGGYDDRRGGYDDRRGGYDDRRGGGGYDDRRGGGGYDDRDRRDGGRYGGGGSSNRRGYGFGGDRDRDGYGGDRYGDRDRGHRDGPPRDGPPRDGPYSRDRDGPPREEREAPRDVPTERPRLQLQKRTKPIENEPQKSSSSIFGSAKPVDTAAREREIEEKIRKEEEAARERLEAERERRDERRPRRNSDREHRERRTSGSISDEQQGHQAPRRERKTSSSSSGKGIRTVGPPPTTPTRTMARRDSELSNHSGDHVFDDERSPPQPKPTTPRSGDDVKLIPAPPPSENVWAKRKQAVQPSPPAASQNSTATTTPQSKPSKPESEKSPPTQSAPPATAPATKAWGKGKPVAVEPADPPKENVWAKRKAETVSTTNVSPKQSNENKENINEKNNSSTGTSETKPIPREEPATNNKPSQEAPNKSQSSAPPANAWVRKPVTVSINDAPNATRVVTDKSNAWGRGPPSGGGAHGSGRGSSRGGRGSAHSERGRGGRSSERRPRPEKPLPKSIDEMPKADENDKQSKNWSHSNKFQFLQDEEEDIDQ